MRPVARLPLLRRALCTPSGAAKLAALAERAVLGGGIARIERQHAAGKLTARERIEALVDASSFRETQQLAGDVDTPGAGVVTGRASIAGRPVHLYAQDFTVAGGSLTAAHARKICATMDAALAARTPILSLNDSGGARIQEGVAALAGYTDVFLRNVAVSGVVPQISVIAGPCAGGAVYSPALTDFVSIVRGSYMFLTGPDVVQAVMGESVSREDLGGADAHAARSGVAALVADSDLHAMRQVRELLSYVPDTWDAPSDAPGRLRATEDPIDREDAALERVVPVDANEAYDMRDVIRRVVDDGRVFETHADWAGNIVTCFAALGGRNVGVVANQPATLAGVLDINASCKAARFVRFCDSFNIPVVTFVDVPGFLPGSAQEHGGVIRHGAKLLYAYAEATTPKITLITRKAYGGAYCVMSSKHLRGDANFAWPSAEIAVMGASGAAQVLARGKNASEVKRYEKEYAAEHVNAVAAARNGYLDAIVQPRETRRVLVEAVLALAGRKDEETVRVPNVPKKHGCVPL